MRKGCLLLLLPLWLGAAALDIRSRAGARPRRRLVIAGFILAGSVLAWLLPMVWLAGGGARPPPPGHRGLHPRGLRAGLAATDDVADRRARRVRRGLHAALRLHAAA